MNKKRIKCIRKVPNYDAVAILRVSSSKQKDNSSHDVQEQEITSYAQKNNLNIIKMVRIVESAWDSDYREEFHETIISAVDQGIYNILFYMTDRESRNFTDIETNQKLIKQGKIAVHYVKDNKILDKNSSNSEFLMREFQTLTDKQLSCTISSKVKDAMRCKAQSGSYPGSKVPLGYMLQRGANGVSIAVPDVNEENIKLARREFKLKSQNKSYNDIRSTIVDEGLIPYDKIKNYHISSIQRRIENQFYRGTFTWNGIIYNGSHEIIIDRNVLDVVDSFAKNKYPIKYTDSNTGLYAYGWMKCAVCGCNVVFDPKAKKSKKTGKVTSNFHYYHCSNGKKEHDKQMNISESKIKEQFEAAIDSFSITEVQAQQIADALNKTQEKMKVAIRRQMEDFRQALINLNVERDKVYNFLSKGTIDELEYKRQIANLNSEGLRYTRLLENASVKVSDAGMQTAKYILELAIKAKGLWSKQSQMEQRAFLDRLLSNPRLNGETIEYDLKKPLFVLAKMNQTSDWRPQRDSNPCLSLERAMS